MKYRYPFSHLQKSHTHRIKSYKACLPHLCLHHTSAKVLYTVLYGI